jgi:hypothetical protein
VNSKYKPKYEETKNITRNELFRERNSVPIKGPKVKNMLRNGFAHNGILNHRTNHSLYNSGKNPLFSKLSRHTGNSLGGKESLVTTSSPKLNQLKSDLGKLKNDLDRKISRDNAKFLKEFDKFNSSNTQNKYVKPKLKLVQKEGQSQLGMKAFSKMSFSRSKNSRDRFSTGYSCQIEKLSQNTTTSNTIKQLEKVRVFDVRSKWFKPKKSTNYSEKNEKSKKKFKKKQSKDLQKIKSQDKPLKCGLMLSLRHKIKNKKKDNSADHSNSITSNAHSIDLYSKLKSSQQKSQKSIKIGSPSRMSFYKKIYRYLLYFVNC